MMNLFQLFLCRSGLPAACPAWPWLAGARPLEEGGGARSAAQRQELQRAVLRLLKAYAAVQQAAGPEGLAQDISDLMPRVQNLARILLQWAQLVEGLVQEAERQFGAQRGYGAYKKEQVKAALLHLVARPELRLPRIPEIVQPFLLEGVVDWTVDWIVTLLNKHESILWVGAQTPARVPLVARWWNDLVERLRRWIRRVLWDIVLSHHALAPAMRPGVDALARALEDEGAGLVRESVFLAEWIWKHHDEAMAMVDVLDEAVLIAEGLLEKTGPERKAFVHDLVMAFLQETGFTGDDSPVLNGIIGFFLDASIDVVVELFNRRGLLTHRASRS